MTGPDGMDPRILQALALLQSVARERAGGASGAEAPLLGPSAFIPPTMDPDLVSATDLLSMWLPEHTGGFASGWETLRADAARSLRPEFAPPGATAGGSPPPVPLPALAPLGISPGVLPAPLLRDDQLEEAHADAALDCLYEFLHALGRRDISTAMSCVAPSFHTLDKTGEMDRRGLGLRLESLLERLRGLEWEVTFASLPEPIPHPAGILVHCTIQFDGRDAAGAPADTLLLERVALLRLTPEGQWRIHSLSQVEPL